MGYSTKQYEKYIIVEACNLDTLQSKVTALLSTGSYELTGGVTFNLKGGLVGSYLQPMVKVKYISEDFGPY